MSAEESQRPIGADANGGGGVSVVLDTSDYLGSIHSNKPRGVRWVRGLAPEDEENERETLRAREELAAAERERAEMAAELARDGVLRRWLRRPLLLCVLYLVVLCATYQGKESLADMMRLDFPVTEKRVLTSARFRGENLVSFILRIGPRLFFPSGLGAVAAGWLCFLVGSAAHHFTALCGVGTAMLSVMAAVAQLWMLWLACGISDISNRWECGLPIVLYWVCSIMRVGGPLLALWCASPVMDMAREGHALKYVMALPLFVFVAALLTTIKTEEPAVRLFQAVHEVAIPVVASFIWCCWNQPIFTVAVTELKLHTD